MLNELGCAGATIPGMKSYIFRVETEKDEEGGWVARVPVLPGCAASGETPEEAVEFVRDLAQAYIDVLLEDGRPVPTDATTSVVEGAAVAIVA
jgi:predicted RNase H-like HicB family nuclease